MQKTIHAIWLPTLDTLTDSGKANIAFWRSLNPTWQVRLWDTAAISGFISSHCGIFAPVWAELIRESEKAADPKPYYGKMSDFARLLICQHHSSDWNCYVDDDMVPLRPLDDWMAETHWHDHQLRTPKGVTPQASPNTKVDWEKIRVVFSGENVNARGVNPAPNNNFILARPGSPVLDEIIHHCVSKRKENVLRSFGPWAIADYRQTIADFVRTKGFFIVPWHYFNFIPKEHEMGDTPPPPWTVALHHQSLRWTDGSPTGWLAGGRKPVKMH